MHQEIIEVPCGSYIYLILMKRIKDALHKVKSRIVPDMLLVITNFVCFNIFMFMNSKCTFYSNEFG